VNQSFAQDKERLRSSMAVVALGNEDTAMATRLNWIAWDSSYEDLAAGIKYGEMALRLSEKLNFQSGILEAYNTLGATYGDMGNINKAIEYHQKGIELANKLGDKRQAGRNISNLAIVYTNIDNPVKAMELQKQALAIYLELNTAKGLASTYLGLGGIYLKYEDSVQLAEACFKNALKYATEINYSITIGNCHLGLSQCAFIRNDTIGCDRLIQRAITIFDSIQDKYDLSQTLMHYAGQMVKRKNYTRAEQMLWKSMAISDSIGLSNQTMILWLKFSELYEQTGRNTEALNALKKHSDLKDSLLNENVLRHQRELEAVYENDKKESEIENLKHQKKLSTIYFICLCAGVLLLAVFLIVLFNRNQLRKKNNQKLSEQKKIIEEKNRNITDSITYARRIQDAIVPEESALTNRFESAFVLNRPRDIVSGDFWWYYEKTDHFLLAAADCTGHGVPGGFMSVMGASFLSEIVTEKNLTNPAEILSLLRLKLIGALKQDSTIHTSNEGIRIQDGMDIVMCSVDKNNLLQFACANNPLWLVRNGSLTEYKADKFPVGIHHSDLLPFTLREIQLQPGDQVYIFSDGYADQFGGPKGKKFKYSQMKELIVSLHQIPMKDQKEKLYQVFLDWKTEMEQVDDVLMIGVRI
jgi:serine phosphatase RsbU (regulator of sigma subunit)